ncbi:MAG: class I SAM-dependent methyltransferase [Chloroflexi bacterium]|nr:class I SAM-dependent methyltransferase [Chloroflexota bacterium]
MMTQDNQVALRAALNQVGTKWGKINQARLRLSLKYAKHQVLDIGCSRGDYLSELSRRGHETFGVDIMAHLNWAAINHPLVIGDANDLPYQDLSFDTVLAFEVLEHVPNPQLLLSEIRRVIRHNALISVPNCLQSSLYQRAGLTYHHYVDRTHLQFFSEGSFSSLLHKAGFKIRELCKINLVAPEVLVFYSWHFPELLALTLGHVLARVPLKRKIYMTLLAVVEK